MTLAEIKGELHWMIESEQDIKILEVVRFMLENTNLNPFLKEKLTARAIQSEEDIREGRTYGRDEVIQRTQR